MNELAQLKQYSTLVVDTGDIAAIGRYQPMDATTNPSLIYKAAQSPEYKDFIEQAISYGKALGTTDPELRLAATIEKLSVIFGSEILKIVPGRVSTEVDARFSFDTEATVAAAERLITHYEDAKVNKRRVLIKIAATYEGIQAAKYLEAAGIATNMTLIFSLEQAVLCAEAGVTLISPFVGRIYDWYKSRIQTDYAAEEDPGVLSVRNIYNYYRTHGYSTTVMAASFRNIGQIKALAGCDYLTISPNLLEELANKEEQLSRKLFLSPIEHPDKLPILTEKTFRWRLNENVMAHEKIAEGIRLFAQDNLKLKQQLASYF